MSQYRGPIGKPYDVLVNDRGTNSLSRSASAGPLCATEDASVMQRSIDVWAAWELAKFRYAVPAIIAHTEEDFYELIQGAVPMVLVACGVVLTTTMTGAGLGAMFGGAGALPGAALGFTVGTTLLEVLGLAFLVVFVKDRLGDIAVAMYSGACLAWDACGERSRIDDAARKMSDGIGLFYAALLQALLMYLGGALANKTLTASRAALRGSKLFQSCNRLEAWITRNFGRLYEKHLGQRPPGILPPVTRNLADWEAYIRAIELKPEPNKGMLWSKIGEARALAMGEHLKLTCMEKLLNENGFLPAYKEVFGSPGIQNATTEQIWRWMSVKYAQSLRGRVIAIVDDAELAQAIKTASIKPVRDLTPGEMAIDRPIFLNELMEITTVMEKNPNISVVEIRDALKPEVVIKLMTRQQVLESKAALLH